MDAGLMFDAPYEYFVLARASCIIPRIFSPKLKAEYNMTPALLARILITWVLFLPVPVINGILRETWYKALIGTVAAHIIGVVIISAAFLGYAYVSLWSLVALLSSSQLWLIGFIWLILTLLFEFGIGITEGRSWSYMLADYKLWEGRIWPLVLATVLLSPIIVQWFVGNGAR
jgi:small-conductance mechanosensitive channel